MSFAIKFILGIFTAAAVVFPPLVTGLLESMCFSPTFYRLTTGGGGAGVIEGPRDPAWNRLYPTDVPWSHSFWGLSNFPGNDSFLKTPVVLSFVKNSLGDTLDGWVSLDFKRVSTSAFHYLAVWAVNEHNEVYGEFVYTSPREQNFQCKPHGSVQIRPQDYIPCSAGPANAAHYPNMFVYAHLTYTKIGNSFGSAKTFNQKPNAKPKHINMLWRSPAQTWCDRPKKFRFMFAMSAHIYWEDHWCGNWGTPMATIPPKFDNMQKAGNWAPDLLASDWIYPQFYGIPSRNDQSKNRPFSCGGKLSSGHWVDKVIRQDLEPYWFDLALWNNPDIPDWDHKAVVARSTCMGNRPDVPSDEKFANGRCANRVDGNSYHTGSKKAPMQCLDESEALGTSEFKEEYNEHLNKTWLAEIELNCTCLIWTDHPPKQYSRMFHDYLVYDDSDPVLPSSDPPYYTDSASLIRTVEEEPTLPLEKRCILSVVSPEEQGKAGICVHSKVGILIYGVRQWHGVTSLGVTLLVTPLTIFIARYYKGEAVLSNGRLPIKGWYMTHVMFLFPVIWMHSSGFTTLSRQREVLGYSLTSAASFHRILGLVTLLIFMFQIITGFLRPINKHFRRVYIFMHWFGGVTQHILEVILCITVRYVPASPSQSYSLFNPEFGTELSSFVSCLIMGWLVFSGIMHIGLTIHIKLEDIRLGDGSRAVFPIIIPLLAIVNREELELGRLEREQWIRRIAMLTYGFVTVSVYALSVVSIYQALYDTKYYGFGPMSCTHALNGTLVNFTEEASCVESNWA